MTTSVLNFLERQLEIYESEKNMFFESYATKQAIDLLKKRGVDALLESLDGAINSKGVSPIAKMFFIEHRNSIIEIKNRLKTKK